MNISKQLASLALAFFSTVAIAENGVTDKEILIGQFAAISGPAAQLGQRMQVGMQAYFTAVNAQGGVNGRASYFDETERIVQHLTTLGVKNIAVLYQNDAYGKAGLDGVTQALAKRQLKAVATATVERNSADVSQSQETLIRSGPEAIMQISAYKSWAALIKQARAKDHQAYNFTDLTIVGRGGKFIH